MADEFSFLTDSDDERAVEDVLAQAMDHSVLEQLAAINCSSFSTSDNLPSHLETRFRKLKSLPTTTSAADSRFHIAKSKSLRRRSDDDPDVDKPHPAFCTPVDENKGLESPLSTDSTEEHSDGSRGKKKGLRSKPKPKSIPSSNTTPDSEIFKEKSFKWKSLAGSSKSPSDSWSLSSPESESGTLSPPRRRIGCLWCSPKKEKSVSKKHGKENRVGSSISSSDAEILKSFSIKEQKKIMKKAMREEEKINREAEKIVKWAKHVSGRMMDDSGLDDFKTPK